MPQIEAMTASQWSFYQALVKKAHANDPVALASALVRGLAMTKKDASTAIDKLKQVKPEKAVPAYVPPMGSYLVGGVVYTLKQSKYKTNVAMYADGDYYGTVGWPKANKVVDEHLNTADKAHAAVIAYAKATGKCGVCHKTLTDPESIAAGIGPICAKKYGF